MRFESLKIIKNLEEIFKTGYNLPVVHGYVVVNKLKVVKLIDDLYASLPDDVKKAREYLKNNNCSIEKSSFKRGNTYDILAKFEKTLEVFPVLQYSIVNIIEIEHIIDQLYETLPEEIMVAEKMQH